MKERNHLVLVNGMGYYCLRAAISLRVQYHVEVVEGDVNRISYQCKGVTMPTNIFVV